MYRVLQDYCQYFKTKEFENPTQIEKEVDRETKMRQIILWGCWAAGQLSSLAAEQLGS